LLSVPGQNVWSKDWINEHLDNGPQNREDKWTKSIAAKSIAVGNKGFVETVKSAFGFRAKGRKTREAGAGFELREPPAPYGALFGGKNEDIGADNTYYWDINL
jgi:hypothetical protein